MVWKFSEAQHVECRKVMWELIRYTRGKVLDVGCGAEKAFPHFVGVDNCVDNRLFGSAIKPDVTVQSADDLDQWKDGSQDAVFSSHLLAHMVDPQCGL